MRERNWLDNIGVPVDPWVDKLLQRDDFDRLLAVARAAEDLMLLWMDGCEADPLLRRAAENLREKLKGSSGLET
jgi:hypothetical protein